ncbi:hypothetical protein BX616_006813 [Lobosporangium transversale]|uniref:BTB domain-containing protein n=1 Tax=Lobosporangium transversale TaxID=64571 RepID=A0A1Y2G5G9_9FUNG|nr:hypothetical protein BCR41DRAFT_402311 [Lobosporangium transversale]KAF9915143.1 hypothetical protein BX616_006813 [Lobosporangium transversale]ORY95144.1 hypothetical protein BCR41DRAFT_402311 [Lobosporangium transversale]|eukprot:XP_021875351.1 hypothetical protein BCR41DRAFT_402311 [Lobosporangium transversale]
MTSRVPLSSDSYASPPKSRIVSHWTKSTPEEGVQVIFTAAEVQQQGAQGVQMETHPPSSDRPCQWDMRLRLVHPLPLASAPTTPESTRELFLKKQFSTTQQDIQTSPALQNRQNTTTLNSTAPFPLHMPGSTYEGVKTASFSNSSVLLNFTLDRLLPQDPESRARSDNYRTLYIYSPKMKRDICVHAINRESWPQNVVFDAADVAENQEQEYHFQLWLAGSSPRQMDAKTSVRLKNCDKLLWAMRKDTATANVEIIIKDTTTLPFSRDTNKNRFSSAQSCSVDSTYQTIQKENETLSEEQQQCRLNHRPHTEGTSTTFNDGKVDGSPGDGVQSYQTHSRNGPSHPQTAVFRAHKCILETTAFFSRMLNGNFKEAQADENGKYRVELSNDMFNLEIMDYLLDYLYTREPIVDELNSTLCKELDHYSHDAVKQDHVDYSTRNSQVHHIISANVGLNLEKIITETRRSSHSSGLQRCQCQYHRYRNHHQYPLSIAGLGLKRWGALYRAAAVLEDKELQAETLQQIQKHLDPESTLDHVLMWGYEHNEVKDIMFRYLNQKRREVFGDERRNKLRPYLWAEYEDQVETLVEITSQIARH